MATWWRFAHTQPRRQKRLSPLGSPWQRQQSVDPHSSNNNVDALRDNVDIVMVK
jgi:hypothetical protein